MSEAVERKKTPFLFWIMYTTTTNNDSIPTTQIPGQFFFFFFLILILFHSIQLFEIISFEICLLQKRFLDGGEGTVVARFGGGRR